MKQKQRSAWSGTAAGRSEGLWALECVSSPAQVKSPSVHIILQASLERHFKEDLSLYRLGLGLGIHCSAPATVDKAEAERVAVHNSLSGIAL